MLQLVVSLLALALVVVSPAAAQQPAKVPRIGYLRVGPATAPTNQRSREAFLEGLRELGYVQGKNIVIEWRFAEGRYDRLPDLAAELVRLQVDVLVAGSTPEAVAAKNATKTLPIVFAGVGDPVATGLVASLASPGGNLTGLSLLSRDLDGKRLELLKETIPEASTVAVLGNPANPTLPIHRRELQAAGGALGVQVQLLEVRTPDDFERAFAAASTGRAAGLLVLPDALADAHRARIAALAARSGLPAIYAFREWPEAGGLMSYGPSISDSYRRAAAYVDKILKGAKPGGLPVEQPTKFELVVNLKVAKGLGLTIPQSLLLRAEVFE
jgi:ABC-type uncharacterized transport system substrate-binding protein